MSERIIRVVWAGGRGGEDYDSLALALADIRQECPEAVAYRPDGGELTEDHRLVCQIPIRELAPGADGEVAKVWATEVESANDPGAHTLARLELVVLCPACGGKCAEYWEEGHTDGPPEYHADCWGAMSEEAQDAAWERRSEEVEG